MEQTTKDVHHVMTRCAKKTTQENWEAAGVEVVASVAKNRRGLP